MCRLRYVTPDVSISFDHHERIARSANGRNGSVHVTAPDAFTNPSGKNR
jgi:hypothetical protein